ncbi:MAG TPA: hypothetical protein VF483_01130 [Gemmatimonadaceae bacterium]
MSQLSSAPRAPYALEPVVFPFPALAAMAGRAPMGGPRELALACLLTARLVADACHPSITLPVEQRRARAAGARHWLGAATLPAPVRTALVRLAEATGGGLRGPVCAAFDSVIAVTANQLDVTARLELTKLAQAIAE